MARKTLLNESEIRRFMKLANIQPIGEERLSEMYHSAKRDDDEESMKEYSLDTYKAAAKRDYENDLSEDEKDLEMDVSMDDKPAEDPMDEPEMDDMDMDKPEMDMGAGAGAQINLDDFLSALESALEDVTGEEVSTDMDMDDDDKDMGMDLDMEMGDEGGDDDEPGMRDSMMEEADEDEDEDPGMRDMMESEDEDLMEARVERIAKRVAERLMAENKKASNIDALTERIFNRLAGK